MPDQGLTTGQKWVYTWSPTSLDKDIKGVSTTATDYTKDGRLCLVKWSKHGHCNKSGTKTESSQRFSSSSWSITYALMLSWPTELKWGYMKTQEVHASAGEMREFTILMALGRLCSHTCTIILLQTTLSQSSYSRLLGYSGKYWGTLMIRGE